MEMGEPTLDKTYDSIPKFRIIGVGKGRQGETTF